MVLWGGWVLETGSKDSVGKSTWVSPCLLWGWGCRGASICLSAVLSTQGRWVVALQFPPFLSVVGNFSLPARLLRKLLSLSPQVIFHHVALKSWA